MKLSKILVAGAIVAGLSVTSAMAMGNYNKGFKYYNKLVFRKSHLKSINLAKVLGISTTAQMKALLKDNAKGLISALKAKGRTKAAKGIERIVKNHRHYEDLQKFLIGLMNGKMPAGCS